MISLTVATYNIGSCADCSRRTEDGKIPVDPSKTARTLADLHADVYGIQEAYLRGPEPAYSEQAKNLASAMHYDHYVYAKGEAFDWGDEIGNAVISRFPIADSRSFPIPKPTADERRAGENEWYEDRVLLETEILTPSGQRFLFMTAHFGLNLLERERMVAAICRRLDRAALPVILTGDFNALPDDAELAPIRERLTDVAAALGKREYTFASFDPDRTLDYIFVSREFTPLDFAAEHVVVSDHMPLWAKLGWEDRK